jgi:hypothetical protein
MNQACFQSDLLPEKEKFKLFHENNKFNHYKKATFAKYFLNGDIFFKMNHKYRLIF